MDSFIVAFNVVMPLFILIGLGYFIKRMGLVAEASLKEFNSLVFKIFLPVLLFHNMYQSDFSREINVGIIIYSVISILLIFGLLFIFVPKFERQKPKAAVMIQGMYRSNFALFGIAVTESMYGTGNADVTGILVAAIVPLFNVLAVCLFEIYKGSVISIRKILAGIVKNPLIIGTALGLVCNFSGIIFPSVIGQSVLTLGNLATPVALIALGGTFTFGNLVKNKIRLAAVTTMRLLVIPLAFVALSIALGYRGKELFALYMMFASPTAVASFAMADAMGGDGEMAGQIVVLTTVVSLFSCISGIFIMEYIGVI